jgi:hypothetical protein
MVGCGAMLHAACGDAVAPPGAAVDLDFVLPELETKLSAARVEKISGPLRIDPSRRSPPVAADALPPEFNEGAILLRYYTVAGFTDDAHQAYGTSVMHYFANRARQTVDLKLRYNGAEVTSTSGFTEESFFLPWHRSMVTTATLGISGTCGHAVHATGTHNVWDEFITSGQGLLSWGHKGASSNGDGSQSPCLQSGGGPGGGGGWGDEQYYICYYYDWYDYLGAFLFREWVYCVPLNAE